jgi:hypothetical protein
MAAKFTRLTQKIAIQLHLVAERSNICSSCSRQPVQKLLDTPSYVPGHVSKSTAWKEKGYLFNSIKNTFSGGTGNKKMLWRCSNNGKINSEWFHHPGKQSDD